MKLLSKDEVRVYLRNNGISSSTKIEEILTGFDFSKPVYELTLDERQELFQFIRNPSSAGVAQAGNWYSLQGATMSGTGIFGGGSGRHLHKFVVAHPFPALEGTAGPLERNWDWAGGGPGGQTQIYVPPRFLGHLSSLGPQ